MKFDKIWRVTEFDEALVSMGLNDYQQIWFRERYLTILGRLTIAYAWTRFWFWIFTTVISIGSVSLVMLTSLGAVGFDNGWVITMVSIIVSFAVALANKFLYAGNNIQKKYINDRQTLEKIRAEGWKFIGRIGKYADSGAAFSKFVSKIESIRASYVSETIAIVNSQAAGSPNNSLVHAPPGNGPSGGISPGNESSGGISPGNGPSGQFPPDGPSEVISPGNVSSGNVSSGVIFQNPLGIAVSDHGDIIHGIDHSDQVNVSGDDIV